MKIREMFSKNKHKGDSKSQLLQAFGDFLPMAVTQLNLSTLPRIKLQRRIAHKDQPAFGQFSNDQNEIQLAIEDRHINDIIRTLAHELVHFKQHKESRLHQNSGKTGSSHENEAHAEAGKLMRHFGKAFPHYFHDKAITID